MPNIIKYIFDETKLTILKGIVEERNEWVGVKGHVYKTYKSLKIFAVPTLLLVSN